MNRDRKLLDLAHRMSFCAHCGNPTPDGCEPAHANWSEYGKGAMCKAHDHWHAALCHKCHHDLDQGCRMSKEDRKDMWLRAHIRTMDWYWSQGWLSVS